MKPDSHQAEIYYVYILYSPLLDKHYVGFSKYRGKRKRQHSTKSKHWTGKAHDWTEVFCRKVNSRTEARELEKKIKGRGAKRFLENLGREDEADGQA